MAKSDSTAGMPTYPVTTIAKLLLLTERRVQQLAKDGVIPKGERARYELAPAVQGYIRYLQERAIGSGGKGSPADYHTEKSRLVKFQADRAELDVNVRKNELLEAADVKRQWEQQVADCKTRLLSIGSKAAPMVIAVGDAGAAQDILDDMVREALTELANEYTAPTSSGDLNDVVMGTTTEAEGE